MASIRLVPLDRLQPSQLYVLEDKLDAVLRTWPDRAPSSLPPLPVRRYGERLVLTDGHSRALAAHRAGLGSVPVVEDEDDLDDEAYGICVSWCLEAGIQSIADLNTRVIDAEAYETLWLGRCRQMHALLAKRRGSP